jgi:hypothetical protein
VRFNEPRAPKGLAEEPLKHVIDEYKVRAQVVTCVCGWHGSTAAPFGQKSAWELHKAEFRAVKS